MTLEPSTDQLQSLSLHEDRKWERKSSCMDASLHGDTATSQHVEAEIWQDLKRCLSLIYLVFFLLDLPASNPPVQRKRSAMCDVYRVSSSGRVEQMEAELSQQLSALRAEIEEHGSPHREVPSRCYRCGSSADDYFVSCVR